MNRRTHTLARLRRHRFGVGRLVLVLFAAASLAAGATPCLAMAVAGQSSAVEHGGQHGMQHDGARPGAQHGTEHGAQHGHLDRQHAPANSSALTDAPPHPSPSHCPHCPLPAAMPGHDSGNSHARCSAFDATSDHAQPNPSLPHLKHVLLVTALEIPPALRFRPPDAGPTRTRPPRYAAVAINLRHCVLLI